jgi:simple sugar transport system ATP-binding protein
MEKILKVYSNGFVANKAITFSVDEGEIHALLGENGAGKTTLMNILFGLETHQGGDIFLNGEKANINNPLTAIKYGIGMVHQHFKLVPSLTISENIMLGLEPNTKYGTFDFKQAVQITKKTSEKYNMKVDPYALIEDVSVGVKQQVEIIKILVRGAKILVLDEPTAVLTPQETVGLFEELKHLRDLGHTIIFISHKLNEVVEICDRYTVLRNGELIGVRKVAESNASEMSNMMIGRSVDLEMHKDAPIYGEELVSVKKLSYTNIIGVQKLDNVSFNIHGGEILGIAAIEGNGQKELAEILAGLSAYNEGSVKICNVEISSQSIRQMRETGMAVIPEDRYVYGCAATSSVKDNLVVDRFFKPPFVQGPFLRTKQIEKITDELIRDYQIKTKSSNENVSMLSGGNIQKIIVAREFTNNPKIIIANQPTRGIDIGTAELIRSKLVELSRKKNVAVLLVTADFDELLEVSDRILVLYNGRIVKCFPVAHDVDRFELGEYMLGVKEDMDRKGTVV